MGRKSTKRLDKKVNGVVIYSHGGKAASAVVGLHIAAWRDEKGNIRSGKHGEIKSVIRDAAVDALKNFYPSAKHDILTDDELRNLLRT